MIQIFDDIDETKPRKVIEFEFPDKEFGETFPILEIYEKIEEEVDEFSQDSEKDEFNSTMYVYLKEGDIWMNCGLTPPQSDIKLWIDDFEDKTVIFIHFFQRLK